MSQTDPPTAWFDRSAPGLSVAETIMLEKVCDAFEAAWRAGARPEVGAAVAGLADPVRSVAARELAELDAYYRRKAGDPLPAGGAARSPVRAAVIISDGAITQTAAGFRTSPAPSAVGEFGDYQLLDEVARGGMGVVYRAQDRAIGRDVAVKVLHDRYRGDPVAARRFVEEARIAGQLQHPGIPPVFEVGELLDGSPFLAMKLIKGRTLADQLAADPPPDRDSLLGVFEDICQAVAYAHDRGVVHRDLKPANVMVGAFAEVQVMDWGLAKVLGREEPPAADADPDATTIHDPRSGDDGPATRAGSVLGTPAYMPPEQAAGAVGEVDRRADVFGLGAILCTVLTGKAPYLGDTAESTRVMAARGHLAAAFDRLGRCGAELELVALCKRCLAPDKADRPTDAGEVADAVAGLRAAATERARRAEVERGAAEARAAEQHKRRRVQAVFGMAFTALIVLGGAFGWWAREQRLAQRARTEWDIQLAVEDAVAKYGRARGAAWDLALWAEARAAALHAEARAADAPPAVQQRVRDLLAEIEQVGKNRRLVAELLEIQAGMGDQLAPTGDQNFRGADERYARAFREYGTDPFQLSPEQGADLLISLGTEVRVELAAALDDWAYVRFVLTKRMGAAAHIFQVTRRLDPDPIRNQIRDTVVANDYDGLLAIAAAIDSSAQPVQTVNLISLYLYFLKIDDQCRNAIRYLKAAQIHHAGDFQINHNLAYYYLRRQQFAESVKYGMAAVAVRPKSAVALMELFMALRGMNRIDDAIAVGRRGLRVAPTYINSYLAIARLLEKQGKVDEAVATLRAAAAALDPADVTAHTCTDLTHLLFRHDWYGDALRVLLRVLEHRPEWAHAFRYDAACFAAMVSTGRGKDPPPAADRPALRRKAFDWLTADLAARRADLAADPVARCEPTHNHLRHQLGDSDLADVREPASLARLSADERVAWEKLWADVAALATLTGDREKLLQSDESWARLHRFRTFTEQENWVKAAEEHDGLIRLRPDNPANRLRCGDRYAEVARWTEARADYDAAFALRRHDDPMYWFQHAFLFLMTGDEAGYRRHCGQMLDHFGPEPIGLPLMYLAHACVLAPGALGDPARVVQIARKRLVAPQDPGDVLWARHVLALAQFRAAEYAAAGRTVPAANNGAPLGAQAILNGFVLAMTQHRQGRAQQARDAFETQAAVVRQVADTAPRGASYPVPPGWRWRDWLAVQMLQTEAAAVLAGDPPKIAPK